MTEYRFHLQKYRPGSKTVCPECGRKACFTRYIDEAGEISFPNSVGMCDHINSCGYHYTPKEYFRDNPAVKERLNGQERFGGTRLQRMTPSLQPAVFAVLQFQVSKNRYFLQDCRNCKLQMTVSTCRNPQKRAS